MALVTLDYQPVLTVDVDTDTGKVIRVGVNVTPWDESGPESVFTGMVDDLPEYVPVDHPVAQAALEIAERLIVKSARLDPQSGDVDVTFELREV